MMKFLFYNLLALLLTTSISCLKEPVAQDTQKQKERKTETVILMHNPNAVRFEYSVDKGKLDFWYSPKAGESLDYYDRNFSNRDDFTSIFDNISITGLPVADFVECIYDPFYSQIVFKNQVLHVATFVDHPAMIIWLDKPGTIRIKTDKQDTPLVRNENEFTVKHPDRGYTFEFAALMGKGEGSFRQQLQIDRGRSTYAEANLAAEQPLIIGAGLEGENRIPAFKALLDKSPQELIQQTQLQVDEATKYGRSVLKEGHEDLEKLMDINRKIWYSMQDKGGSIRASIKTIYYLIWVRDGGMATAYNAYSGWADPVKTWAAFQMHNPTIIEDEEPSGRFFGQLVNGKITKWEEDGLFYALWSAFTHYTQTGNDEFVTGENLVLLKEGMDWLERYCWDDSMQLFGRYHYCETPFKSSRGYKWDNAVGCPVDWEPGKYKGQDIVRSYDVYINMLSYASYHMLAALSEGTEKAMYLKKAENLEREMKVLFPENGMPLYGKLKTIDGKMIDAEGYGMDHTDYLWGLALPNYRPGYYNTQLIGKSLLDTLKYDTQDQFLAGYFAAHASLDPLFFDQARMMEAMEYAGKQSYRPGKYLPMAYSIIEMLDQEDGDPWHDIRPQPFSMGAWFGALANFGVRRLPYGLAVRPSQYHDSIQNYQYKHGLIDFVYSGSGHIEQVTINGKELQHSLQVPENWLKETNGSTTIKVQMASDAQVKPLLIASSAQLIDIKQIGSSIEYKLQGFGLNNIEFINLNNKKPVITDETGEKVLFTDFSDELMDQFRFTGTGIFYLSIEI